METKSAYLHLLGQAQKYAAAYIQGIDDMPVFPKEEAIAALGAFDEPLPAASSDPSDVLRLLHTVGAPATVAQTGGRYFGYVTGGVYPIAHAADWLTSTYDQNAALYLMSPLASKLEAVCEAWVTELLGLPNGTAAGFVSGSSSAILCALAAARNSLLLKQGYDVAQEGLRNAPELRVVLGEQAHASVLKALSLLGIGKRELILAPVDAMGRIQVDALPPLDETTLLILQAGNANGGGFDPIDELCDLANQKGAWVHVDGAFGLWAAASHRQRHLTAGLEKADSWSADAHKTLNTAYDSGIVLCKHRTALSGALQASGGYLHFSEERDGMRYTPEMSRRSRAISLWATIKQLGASGVAELIDRLCDHTAYFAQELQRQGFIIVNPPCFNQLMVKCETPDETRQVLREVQGSGVCWCGGSVYHNEPVIRVSVCSYRTTRNDIEKSVAAFVQAEANGMA